MTLVAIEYVDKENVLSLLDQRKLPKQTQYIRCSSSQQVADAIREMVVRGAPAIGITAAYGMALADINNENMQEAYECLLKSRPTASNLKWALDKIKDEKDMLEFAKNLHQEDITLNKKIGSHGMHLLSDGGVLTICNTGALATGGHGTALGMVRSALGQGKKIQLYACETRPYNQGSRLTTWECVQDKMPCTLIADSAASALLAQGKVGAVIAGCDRVARNGDTANKIGTYGLAVLAKYHSVPFYIAMPMSTLDLDCPSGKHIPIEQRPSGELFSGLDDIDVWNPAFDVTPADLITGWVSEEGVWTKEKFWL